jgi:outer membrane protein OmpA-like peptidoglycan-associated protein
MGDYASRERNRGGGDGYSGGGAGLAPGKRTLAQSAVPSGVRGRVEQVTGADLGAVQVHTGPDSNEAARELGAQAFTVGQDIHFGAGHYQPGTPEGDNLIAHELAHTIQQRGADGEPQARLEVSSPGDPAEREADRVATAAAPVTGGCACAGACGCGATTPAAPVERVQSTVARRVIQRRTEGEAAPPVDATGGAAAGAAAGATAGAAAGAAAGCADPAEQARVDAFRVRTDLQVLDNIPSPGTGKFDAHYYPVSGIMPVTVKIHFDFVQADNTPGFAGLLGRLASGAGISQFFWTDAEKDDFRNQFVARCMAAWSAKHTLRSTKPCWTFTAMPIVAPIPHADKATAHYAITVHKSSGPGIDYKSGLSRIQLTDPTAQPTGNLWQSDVQESGNFNSQSVARDERLRLERELTAAAATPVQFGRDADAPDPTSTTALGTFAAALARANPSAPLIPVDVAGFASAEGDPTHNQGLSERRARNVAAMLTGGGARQPVRDVGRGPVGAPDDAANRRADITIDHTFETTYASNRYAVGEHEFGHMLGNLDEYQNQTTGATGARQTQYGALITSAGLDQPTWANDTSSIMSAGVDVLPRHYVTLWEALGRMTTPDITQAEWSFH